MTLQKTGQAPIFLQGESKSKPEVKKTGQLMNSSKPLSSKDAVMLGLKTSTKGMIPAALRKLHQGEKPNKYDLLQLGGTIAIYAGIASGGGPLLLGARAVKYGVLGVQHRSKLAGMAKAAAKKLNPKNLSKAFKKGKFLAAFKKLGNIDWNSRKADLLIASGLLIGAVVTGLLVAETIYFVDGMVAEAIANHTDTAAGSLNHTDPQPSHDVTAENPGQDGIDGITRNSYHYGNHLNGDVSTHITNSVNEPVIYINGVPFASWQEGSSCHFAISGHEYYWQGDRMYPVEQSPAESLTAMEGQTGELAWNSDHLYVNYKGQHAAWPEGDAWRFNVEDHQYALKGGQVFDAGVIPAHSTGALEHLANGKTGIWFNGQLLPATEQGSYGDYLVDYNGHNYIWTDGQLYLVGGTSNYWEGGAINPVVPGDLSNHYDPLSCDHPNGEIEFSDDGSAHIWIDGQAYLAWPDGCNYHLMNGGQECIYTNNGHLIRLTLGDRLNSEMANHYETGSW